MQQKNSDLESMVFAENKIWHYIRMNREARGYTQLDICDGICSVPTLSLIERGERSADYWTAEALLDRMRVDKTECECILDDDTYDVYELREAIKRNIQKKEYAQAEKNLESYKKRCGEKDLHRKFLFFQEASLERAKQNPDSHKKKELFQKALMLTAPNYQEIFDRKGVMSDLELECITEIIHCIENPKERELEYEKLSEYFQWDCKKVGSFLPAYRIAMQYYAECLYEDGKLDECMQICDAALKELYATSKVANRAEVFLLRAKARERKGIKTEEEKNQCLSDYMIAYTVISFYDGEEEAEDLRKYIGENYGWESIV